MIPRYLSDYIKSIDSKYKIITITGPRQAGKTTLCRALKPNLAYVNLEDPETRMFAQEDPKQFLAQYPEGAILDEIQRAPNLPSYLQVLVDEPGNQCQFYLSGSQSFALRNTLSQSLAGRTAILELLPLSLQELKNCGENLSCDDAIFKGGFPAIYDRNIDPNRAMADYIATYVERDLRQLNMVKQLNLFQKFIQLCAGRCGQILNLNSLANDVGISQPTAKEWLSLLEASYIVFLLPPYFKNVGKRLIKSPKLYFYDTSLACYLLNIEEKKHLIAHPLKGQLFENLVISEALKSRFNSGRRNNLLFYRDSNGNEVDLLLPLSDGALPVEIKLAATFNDALLKSLKRFSAVETCPRGQWLVYNGRTQKHGGFDLINFADFAEKFNVRDMC